MVIYDSRIVHRIFTRIRNRVLPNRTETQVELGGIGSPAQDPGSGERQPESLQVPESVCIGQDPDANPASGVHPLQSSHTEQKNSEPDIPSPTREPTIRAEDVKLLYSIWVGVFLFCFFLVSFIVIMVVRGVVDSLPAKFRFFANIYLAGLSSFLKY